MRSVDLDHLGAGPLGHVALALRRNGLVRRGHDRPRRQRLPRRRLGAIVEDRGERTLADGQDRRLLARQVSSERRAVELRPDRELDRSPPARKRVVARPHRREERGVAELGEDLSEGLALIEGEPFPLPFRPAIAAA